MPTAARPLLKLVCLAAIPAAALCAPDTQAFVTFEPNDGKAPAAVRYIGQAADGLSVWFGPASVDYRWHGFAIRLEYQGGNTESE